MKLFPTAIFCGFVFLLVACNSQATATSTTIPQPSPTFIATETPTKTLTKTRLPTDDWSQTPSPTVTLTFDVRTIVTRTPAPRAQCPAIQTDKVPDFEYPLGTSETVNQFHDHVLDFLNAGGAPDAIIKLYQQYYSRRLRVDRDAQIIDLTGDNVPELLLVAGDYSVAYLCKDGQYDSIGLMVYTYHFFKPVIYKIKDINRNGIPEVIFLAGDLRHRFYTFNEWDGSEFRVLNEACYHLMGDSSIDIPNNGQSIELILKQNIPIWSEYSMGLPWRKETRTCTWNGTSFILTHTQLAPPDYRFQAVQDGDRATLAGEYDKALGFYQQVIFDDKLDWWSLDRRIAEGNAVKDLNPTPDPAMQDAAEYPNLAAYARFRIMLLHIKQGFLPEAKTVYDALLQKFPVGQPGHAYTEMATAFMDEYTASQSLTQACDRTIAYAEAHPTEILAYLGNGDYSESFYGEQSLEYIPKSVCPFDTDGGQ